ncbi:MAG: methionyl-tRNA formyltransferase [Chloroflexi bacterium]|nr:methionyl-tRNA formyltransferase [Chloroflexota bacterium]
MRIVFMGTPDFAVPALEKLLEAGHDVAGVYTRLDKPAGRGREVQPPPVKTLAQARGLPVFQPPTLRKAPAQEELAALRSEAIVVVAYGKLLPPEVLRIPPLGCVNVHPSLLPRHRGPSPIAGAILAGDSETGVSVMLLDEGMDTGPVLAQVRIPIGPDETAGQLSQRLSRLGAEMLPEVLVKLKEGWLTPQPQDNAAATYTKLIEKEEGELDWRLSAEELARRARAFDPWPGCFTRWQGKALKVLQAVALPPRDARAVGTVVPLEGAPATVGVVAGQGVLGLLRVQLEGRKPVSAGEFVRGARGFVSSVLPLPERSGIQQR